ncbi:hypothetical protein MSG28_011176 [Choristoneura fumiferana]|uniref:Uncharacterized protein n=1 Tax=Choristoneura fumiferana TaxID=7141 RepID=A0ACC0KR36_CHOFU|nr:hypothetical protein MSG28_011176 [Choristoneura fumiferana]
MESVYMTLNYIQTNLLTWDNPFNCKGSDVIVCISGNPGIPDFYIEFAAELHKSTGLPVCVTVKSNILEKQEHLFNLEGQITHKLDLISNKIDKNSKIHLIGHSIGAWLVIEALDKQKELLEKVASINLLFPTIQGMAVAENGKYLNKIVRRFHTITILLFTLVHILPEFLKQFLIAIYLKFNSLPPHYSERILKYLRPKIGEKVLYLAYDEMDRVVELNTEALENIKHLTNVIYSDRDGWAPLSYMDDLKQFQPEMNMKQVSIDHAFVLKYSEEIAEMLVEAALEAKGFIFI